MLVPQCRDVYCFVFTVVRCPGATVQGVLCLPLLSVLVPQCRDVYCFVFTFVKCPGATVSGCTVFCVYLR